MQSVKSQARSGHDEILKLVVVQPVEKKGWPPGYFERTAGALADDPIEHPLRAHLKNVMKFHEIAG